MKLFYNYDFEVIIEIKPAPVEDVSNFKKVGAILCGFNTMGTLLDY